MNQVLIDRLTHVQAQTRTEREQRYVILDGKILRGTQQHLAEKEGELTQMKAFLTPFLLPGRIISIDAFFTQKEFCQEIVASGGDYLTFAKGNQAKLLPLPPRARESQNSMQSMCRSLSA